MKSRGGEIQRMKLKEDFHFYFKMSSHLLALFPFPKGTLILDHFASKEEVS